MQLSPISLAITRLGGVRFSPSALFSSGEQGAWYDPSDLTTLFQDSAGTTPVTAVEQPVGLVLDKRGPTISYNPATMAIASYDGGGASTIVRNGANLTFTSAASGDGIRFNAFTAADNYSVIEFVASGSGTLLVYAGGAPLSVTLTASPTAYRAATQPNTASFTIFRSNSAGLSASITINAVYAIRGNHAFQTTSASRPTLRARYNLLTYSEQFDNAAWTKLGTAPTVTANATIAPDGTNTAERIVFNASGIANRINQNLAASLGVISITLSIYLRGEVGGEVLLLSDGWTNSSDLVLTTTWQRFTVPLTGNATSTAFMLFAKTGTPTCYAWGAQLTQTAVFPSNTYQRIADAATYATGAAFPVGLDADGVDDGLLTNSVDFSATDKMTVWAGVTKNGTTAGVIVEPGGAVGTTANTFGFFVSGTVASDYLFTISGSAPLSSDKYCADSATTFNAPITNVVSVSANKAGYPVAANSVSMRVNGATPTQTYATLGDWSSNFSNNIIYIGRRTNSTTPLNGRIYSLIIRGAQSTAAQISSTESWVAAKTPLGSL